MAAANKPAEQVADELYGLPPGEFTSARDELAKRLRKDDREAANAVKALRKPTVVAWALNRLARERREELDELLTAGEKLQSAQEKLLAGGDRAAFQRAAATERELVAKLAAEAVSLASAAGQPPGAGLAEKVAATLTAAALDDETADQLRAGRLTREREAIGGFGSLAAAEPAPAGRSGRTSAKARSTSAKARSTSAKARSTSAKARSDSEDADSSAKADGRTRPAAGTRTPRGRGSARTRASRGRGRAGSERPAKAKPSPDDSAVRERLAGARTDERHARRALDAATKSVEHAQERAGAAATHAAEAAERAKKTAERLKEAKQAAATAERAHTKAARALKSAETTAKGSDP